MTTESMTFGGQQVWLQSSIHERGQALSQTLSTHFLGTRTLDGQGRAFDADEAFWRSWQGSYVQVEWPDDPSTIVAIESLIRVPDLISIQKTAYEKWAPGGIDAERMAHRFKGLMGASAIRGELQPPSLSMLQGEMLAGQPFGLPQLYALDPKTGMTNARLPSHVGWWMYWSDATAEAIRASGPLEDRALPVYGVERTEHGWLTCLTEHPTQGSEALDRACVKGILERLPAIGFRG